MSDEGSSFEALLRRVAEGSEEAVWELLDRYSKNILRLVRRRLPHEIRSKVDSIDIVQSVWKSLLRKGSKLDALATPEQLVAYISSMAQTKVFEVHRHFTQRAGTDIRRETRFDPKEPQGRRPDPLDSSRVDRRTATPSAIAQAKESWQSALDGAGERGRRILQMKLGGASTDEIALEVGLCERTVRRELAAMLKSLEV